MICCVCGKEFPTSYYSGDFKDICGSSECFKEKFWRNHADRYREDESYIAVNGCLYHDNGYKKNTDGCFLGHGGRKFTIKKNDGTEIVTNDLWYIGAIPEKYREALPDNAEFVK